jgi:hypothetical protein
MFLPALAKKNDWPRWASLPPVCGAEGAAATARRQITCACTLLSHQQTRCTPARTSWTMGSTDRSSEIGEPRARVTTRDLQYTATPPPRQPTPSGRSHKTPGRCRPGSLPSSNHIARPSPPCPTPCHTRPGNAIRDTPTVRTTGHSRRSAVAGHAPHAQYGSPGHTALPLTRLSQGHRRTRHVWSRPLLPSRLGLSPSPSCPFPHSGQPRRTAGSVVPGGGAPPARPRRRCFCYRTVLWMQRFALFRSAPLPLHCTTHRQATPSMTTSRCVTPSTSASWCSDSREVRGWYDSARALNDMLAHDHSARCTTRSVSHGHPSDLPPTPLTLTSWTLTSPTPMPIAAAAPFVGAAAP